MPQPVDVPYRARLVIWLALVIAAGMYFVVIRFLPPPEAEPNPTLSMVLLVCAAGMVAASIPIKARFLAHGNPPSSKMRQQAELIALIFCEGAAVLGVVTWFVTAWPYYWVFLLLGLVGMLLHFPQREG